MNQVSSPSVKQSKEFFYDTVKSIQHSPSPKTLGGAANTELASWYEEAHAYYQNVQSGQENMPDQSTWNEFLHQMRWAYDQLIVQTGPAWDPMNADNPNVNTGTQAVADPFGGVSGTSGNWVHTHEKTRVGFTGDEKRDIWSNEIDLDVAPLSAQVQVVKVMDESLEPPEEVLKVIVKDSATGQQATWVIHDFEDANIRINVPDGKGQVEDLTGLNPSPISVEKFKEGSMGPQDPIANVPGTPIEDRENATLYEAYADETIEFHLDGYGVDGEIQTEVVYGNNVIFTRQTDTVGVTKNADGVTIVTVTHGDGSQDIVEVQKGYEVQLFAREGTLTVDGQAFEDLGEIPEAYEDLLKVNPASGEEGSLSNSPLNPEDTPPDRVEEGVAYYNSQETVSLHNNYDNEIQEYEITTGGTFELSASNYDDRVRVYTQPDGSYRIVVYNSQDPSGEETKEYLVKGPPEEIFLQGFLPGRVNIYKPNEYNKGHNTIFNFQDGTTPQSTMEDLENISRFRVDSNNALSVAEVLAEMEAASAEEVAEEEEAIEWPARKISIHVTGSGKGTNFGLSLIELIETALESGNWEPVLNFSVPSNYANDAVRTFVSALFKAVGSDEEALMQVLDYIPEDVREYLVTQVTMDNFELSEIQEGNQYHSQGTADILNASMEDN